MPSTDRPAARPTMYRVALEARVSPTTAARALRGDPGVAPQTAARVLRAAARLGYQPNRVARALRTGERSTHIALVMDGRMVMPDARLDTNPSDYFFRMLHSLISRLSEANAVPMVLEVGDSSWPTLSDMSVIMMMSDQLPRLEVPAEFAGPLLVIGHADVDDSRIAAVVDYDNEGMVTDAMERLRELGSQRPVLVPRFGRSTINPELIAVYEAWCRRRDIQPIVVDTSASAELEERVGNAISESGDGVFSVVGVTPPILQGVRRAGRTPVSEVPIIVLSEGQREQLLAESVITISPLAARAGEVLAETALRIVGGESGLDITLDYKI